MLSSSAKILKIVKIGQSYKEFKGGNFFETQCRVIAVSCGIKISAVRMLGFVTKHACDRQTGGRTDGITTPKTALA